MIISSSNVVPAGTLSTAFGGVVDNIKTNLGGAVWNPDSTDPEFTWVGTAPNITYVAGIVSGFTSVTIRITGGPTVTQALTLNGCFFIPLSTAVTFTEIEVEFVGSGMMVNFAMGSSFSVPNGGEQAGYQRIPLQDTRVFSSSVDRAAIPVAQSVVREPRTATLNIPNMTFTFATTTWDSFRNFALGEGFFYVLEVDDNPLHSYMAYQPAFIGPVAHASTRSLVRAGVTFRAYHGG